MEGKAQPRKPCYDLILSCENLVDRNKKVVEGLLIELNSRSLLAAIDKPNRDALRLTVDKRLIENDSACLYFLVLAWSVNDGETEVLNV